ncbi:hypothetical protein EXS71_03345 [Candidatus Uhrbacteria bacterium]|nr:hypothetical protein [Candidatus Uhrbacteria bacterium]
MIKNAKRLLVVSDDHPDGDSLGSSCAMLAWVIREGKTVRAFCLNPIPISSHYLDHIHHFTNDRSVMNETFDAILTFDSSELKKTGLEEKKKMLDPKTCPIIVFDHHATTQPFGHINIILRDACATAEIVYRFFETNQVRVDAAMATSLLAGLVFDTSYFSNSGTTMRAVEAAGKLVAYGARQLDVLEHSVKNKSIPLLRLWGLALARLTHHARLNLIYTYFLQKDVQDIPGGVEAIEGMSNFLHAVCAGADSILVLKELPDGKVNGSFRSINMDISKLAKLLGGGGHKKAAGFAIPGKLVEKDGKVTISSL